MLEISDTTHCSFEDLRNAMQDAFCDYAIPLRLGTGAFELMMKQRGLNRSSSRIALVDGKVVAIWLVSVRGSRAYLISSGTVPSFRSRGIARALAQDCIAGLRDMALHTFQTEVLRDNEKATALYYSLGMEQQRWLDCYVIPVQSVNLSKSHVFSRVKWREIAPLVPAILDWAPSWQNADHSLGAIAQDLMCFSAMDTTRLVAYAAVSAENGTIHQIAVRRDKRRFGIATALLCMIQSELPEIPLRLINVQHSDCAFRSLMTCLGAEETAGQYELTMPL